DLAPQGLWLPFFSFRFWTFSSAFFGLTGTLLTLIATMSQAVVLPMSLFTGFGIGFTVAYTLHRLKREQVDSSLRLRSLIGEEAGVVLPVDAEHRGKIRIERPDRRIELVAKTDEKEPLQRGDRVIVIQMDGDTAHVVRP